MSKTPEEMAEAWCKTYYQEQASVGVKDGTERAFLAGYKAAENHFRDATEKVGTQWISVKDRLPEDEEEVLVVLNGESCKDVHVSWYEGGEFGWATLGYVSHWMPLPAPPKEEKVIKNLDQIHRPQKRISVEEAREMFPDKPPKEER